MNELARAVRRWARLGATVCLAAGCSANRLPDASTRPAEVQLATTTALPETAAATAPATISPTTARPDGEVTMAFTGDTLIHRPIVARAKAYAGGSGYDFTPMFARIAPLVSSVDLAVCHMETPVAPPGEALSGHPIYGVPVEVLAAIAGAGYDRCSTASTHSLDRGVAGIDATVNGLEAVGVGNSGMARTPAESEPSVFTVRGIRMAQLSYSFGFNGLKAPVGQEWRVRLIDPQRVIDDARLARSLGAEFVLVSLHWGEEKDWRITGSQRQVAEKVTASGAVDLIVGHHVHVLQPFEEINGRWVLFGLSNIISNLPGGDLAWPASSQDGAVVTIDVRRRAAGGFDVGRPVVHPTWVDPSGYLVRLVIPDLDDIETPAPVAAELRNSLARTKTVLGAFLAT